MAGLESEPFVTMGTKHLNGVRLHDPVTCDDVRERRIRKRERDFVAQPKTLDMGERRTIRSPVPSNVDELALPRHECPLVTSRAAFEAVVVSSVDNNCVQPDTSNRQAPDGISKPQVSTVRVCFCQKGSPESSKVLLGIAGTRACDGGSWT